MQSWVFSQSCLFSLSRHVTWCLELRRAAGAVRELSRGLGGSGPLCPRTCSYTALDSPGGGSRTPNIQATVAVSSSPCSLSSS